MRGSIPLGHTEGPHHGAMEFHVDVLCDAAYYNINLAHELKKPFRQKKGLQNSQFLMLPLIEVAVL